jgi:hypothetical protein
MVRDIKHKFLLSKWLFKRLNKEGMWQELLHNKYLKHKSLAQVEAKPMDSVFYEEKISSLPMDHGQTARFLEDAWLDNTPLSLNTYPCILLCAIKMMFYLKHLYSDDIMLSFYWIACTYACKKKS